MNKEEIIMDWLIKEVGLKKWNDKAVWFAGLPVAVKEFEKFYDSRQAVVDDILCLAIHSEGVAGLHQNDDVASWSELFPGGRFEWLSSLAYDLETEVKE